MRKIRNQIQRLKERSQRVISRLLKIPAIQLIYRVAVGLGDHDTTQRAAGIAYYAILSIFPLLLGLVAIFGFFLPSANLQDALLKFISSNFPGAAGFFSQNIASIIQLRGSMGMLSIVLLIWGASSMFGAINLAINRSWEVHRFRSFFISKANELSMTLSAGVLFLLSLGSSALISVLGGIFGLHSANLIMLDVGSRLVGFLLILVVFLLLYKLIPNTRTYWRDIWPGALAAAVLFEIARTLFVFYLANFANYQLLYGSIASIIILLVWIYYSAFILILGAEFTFQYGRMRNSVITGDGAEK